MLNKNVITIGISGASCSGKSTLASLLGKILPNTTILYQDDFFKNDDEIPTDPVTKLPNWDCQGAIDFDSFVKTLRHLRKTGILPPTFVSKESKNNRNEVGSVEINNLVNELSERVMNLLKENGEKKDEWSFLFVDGFLLYVDQDVINELDIKLFVKTKREILKRRREARSGYVTIEGFWEDPPNYFENIVWPNYVQANKHILMQSGDLEKDENLVSKIINDDLIILESDDVSMLTKNIETSIMKVLDHIKKKIIKENHVLICGI